MRWLQRDVRLLLPADPGRERMLGFVHLFDPRARLASRGSINVDNMREVYLSRGVVIESDVAAEVSVPDGMGVLQSFAELSQAWAGCEFGIQLF